MKEIVIIWNGAVFENDKCFQLFADEFDTNAFILQKINCIEKNKIDSDTWNFKFQEQFITQDQLNKLVDSKFCINIEIN